MRPSTSAVAAALLVATALVGRTHAQQAGAANAAPAGSGTVTVFAAASLTAAFRTMASTFENGHPRVQVRLILAGSSTLVQQIQEGAPADVFASADEANMQKLVEGGQVAGSPQLFARNKLQIVVPAGNPKHIIGLADLTKPGLTVALCGPTVPCGRYAAEAFGRAGVAMPAASQEMDVKAVVNKVTMGEADAGIVYVTDVRAAGSRAAGVDIPDEHNVIARYPIAALKNAPNPTAAAQFIDFVVSPQGQQALARFGFLGR